MSDNQFYLREKDFYYSVKKRCNSGQMENKLKKNSHDCQSLFHMNYTAILKYLNCSMTSFFRWRAIGNLKLFCNNISLVVRVTLMTFW